MPQDLTDLRKWIRHNRDDADSLHALGTALAERGEYRRSFMFYRAAASCRPQNAKYLCSCAGAALSLGLADDAKWHVDRALAVDSSYGEAWQIRGGLYLDTFMQPDEALRSYIKAIELAPDDLKNYQSAARCLWSGKARPGSGCSRERCDAFRPGPVERGTRSGHGPRRGGLLRRGNRYAARHSGSAAGRSDVDQAAR